MDFSKNFSSLQISPHNIAPSQRIFSFWQRTCSCDSDPWCILVLQCIPSTSSWPDRMMKQPIEGLAMPVEDLTQQVWGTAYISNYQPAFRTISPESKMQGSKWQRMTYQKTQRMTYQKTLFHFLHDLWLNRFWSALPKEVLFPSGNMVMFSMK